MDAYLLVLLFTVTFILGILDSAFGQGYGTIGTPVLLLLGISSKTAIPLILFSQAILGMVSSFLHHRLRNVDLSSRRTHDTKRLFIFGITGIMSVVAASILGASLPSIFVRYYIGIMVTIVGILVLVNFRITFTWLRASLIGIISAFNKGLTGGGYGPIVTGGQTLIGVESKSSVGITLSSVALICATGFITWLIFHGLPPPDMMGVMGVAGALSPIIGTRITRLSGDRKLRYFLGSTIFLLGLITLAGISRA